MVRSKEIMAILRRLEQFIKQVHYLETHLQ